MRVSPYKYFLPSGAFFDIATAKTSSVFTNDIWLCVVESFCRIDVDVVCSVNVRSSSVDELIDAESNDTCLLLKCCKKLPHPRDEFRATGRYSNTGVSVGIHYI